MTWSRFFIMSVGLALTPGVCRAGDAATVFQTQVRAVLAAHCTRCHTGQKAKGKIDLAGEWSLERLAADRNLWFRVLAQVEAGTMPPDGKDPLPDADRRAIAAWVRGELTELLAAKQLREGRGKLRRLTRTEYANTVQDLFGIRPLVGLYLPEDGRVDGYDKASAALPLSADGALAYYRIADDLLNRWSLKPLPNGYRPDAASRTVRAAAMDSGQSRGHLLDLGGGTFVSFNSDTHSGRLDFKGARVPGVYRIRVSVYGYQTDKPMPFGIYVGNTDAYPQILDLVKVLEAPPGKPAVLEAEVYLKAGDKMRLVPFGLGVQVPKNSLASRCRGPGLAVQWMEAEEPELPLAGDRLLTADFPKEMDHAIRLPYLRLPAPGAKTTKAQPAGREDLLAALRTTFRRLGARLYRRDLTAAELDQLVADATRQADGGSPLNAAFLDRVAEMMTAPDFLCVVEPPGPLSDFALASRLSYFLWNSTPDEALLDVARKGKLRDPGVLREQTERLLRDPRSERFVADFLDQWLGLHKIDDTTPDSKLYPEYDQLLKYSSVWETRDYFRRMLDEDLGVRHLVESPWVLVNGPLARHYGLSGVEGIRLRQVPLPPSSPFGGIWTQPAVLKVTANGTNTSPVKRGVWVAERLLGTPIPPPPPNIEPVEPDVRGAKTLREQLARHRGSGSCAACHAKFDPYGFALECFDVTGGFRTNYRTVDPEVAGLPPEKRNGRRTWRDGLPVDGSGQTPDGRAFSGVGELRQVLARNPEQLARGVTRHLLTYATGAPAGALDQPAVERVVREAAARGYGLRSLVHALVQSDVFRCK